MKSDNVRTGMQQAPHRSLFNALGFTEEEMKMMVDQGKEDGTIQEDEKEYINNVFEFNDIVASEIMTHRTDMFAVDILSLIHI